MSWKVGIDQHRAIAAAQGLVRLDQGGLAAGEEHAIQSASLLAASGWRRPLTQHRRRAGRCSARRVRRSHYPGGRDETRASPLGRSMPARSRTRRPGRWCRRSTPPRPSSRTGWAAYAGGYEYSRSANPDPDRARGVHGRARGRAARLRVRQRAGRRGHPAADHRQPGSHFVVPHDAYGGTFRLFAKVHERWGVTADPAPLADLAAVEAAITPGETTGGVGRDADQPAAGHRRHRRDRRAGARGRRAGGRGQHLRHALPAAAARARRRRGGALDHQVLRRALRRHRRRPGGRRRRPGRAAALPPERDRRRGQPVRLAGWCCAGCGRWPCGWTGTATTPSRSRRS